MSLRSRFLKTGEERFYSGRKIATGKDLREQLRQDPHFFDDRPKVNPNTRKLIGSIKGGLAASSQPRIRGKFISDNDKFYAKIKAQTGVDAKKIFSSEQVKNFNQLFAKDNDYKNLFTQLLSVGLPDYKNKNQIRDYIDKYHGVIEINGKQVSKLQAQDHIQQVIFELERRSGLKGFDLSIPINRKGANKIKINLPTLEELEDFDPADYDINIYGS